MRGIMCGEGPEGDQKKQADNEGVEDRVHLQDRAPVHEDKTQEEEPECPTILFNRMFISFKNCIVHLLGAVFPLDRPEDWQRIADEKNEEWARFARRAADRLAAWGVHAKRRRATSEDRPAAAVEAGWAEGAAAVIIKVAGVEVAAPAAKKAAEAKAKKAAGGKAKKQRVE